MNYRNDPTPRTAERAAESGKYLEIFSLVERRVSHGILCLTSLSLTSNEGGTPGMLIHSEVKTEKNQYFPPKSYSASE